MNQFWKEALLAWGLVNLLFFRYWARTLPGVHDYFLSEPRPAVTYLSLMILILLLSGLAVAGVALVRRSGDRRLLVATRVTFALLALFGVYSVIVEGWVFLGRPRLVLWVRFIPVILSFAVLAWLQWRHQGWHKRIVPVAVVAIMLLVPLAPIMYAQGLYHTVTPQSPDVFDPQPDGRPEGPGSTHRVVWILFDELDQRLVFEQRPDGIELEELDRLQNESFYATHAYAPSDATLRSVPAMTTGRFVDSAYPRGNDRLMVDFHDAKEATDWREAETIFSRMHDQGHSVNIVGTYHPYCRLFFESLTDCTFVAHYGSHETALMSTLGQHLEGLRLTIPTATVQRAVWDVFGLTASTNEERQSREIDKYRALAPAAIDAASDDSLDLSFLHMNVPHPTGMRGTGGGYYDAEGDRFSTSGDASYFDNLVLADKTLGAIRAAMEEDGQWNDTTVIISSDHGYRSSLWGTNPSTRPFGDLLNEPTDHRVVFLVKPANDTNDPVQYDEPFNLVLMTELVETALRDGLRSTDEAVAWFDEHRGRGPAPYYKSR